MLASCLSVSTRLGSRVSRSCNPCFMWFHLQAFCSVFTHTWGQFGGHTKRPEHAGHWCNLQVCVCVCFSLFSNTRLIFLQNALIIFITSSVRPHCEASNWAISQPPSWCLKLETCYWNHKHFRKVFTEVINQESWRVVLNFYWGFADSWPRTAWL